MSSSCGVEFVEMTSNVVFFPHSPSLSEVVVKVKAVLGWSEIVLEGRYDAGGSRSFTQMIPIHDNNEWDIYKELVDSSQIKSLVVVAVKVKETGRGKAKVLLDLNDAYEDVYDAGPSQPPM